MVNNAEQIYKKIAEKYDFLNHFFSVYIDVLWRKKLFKLISPKEEDRVLDVCTGTGDIAIEIKSRANSQVVGLDISHEMLDVARKKFSKNRLEIPLIIGDALDMPIKSSSFDVVTIGFGLRNLPDYDRGIKEMARSLKKGGRIFILEFAPPEKNLFGFLYWIYLRYIMPIVGGIIAGVKDDYTELAVSIKNFLTPQEMENLLRKHGFRNIKSVRLTFGIAYIYTGELSVPLQPEK